MLDPKDCVQVIQISEKEQFGLFELRFVECSTMREFSLFFPSHEATVGDIYPCTRAMLTGDINSVKLPWLRGKEC